MRVHAQPPSVLSSSDVARLLDALSNSRQRAMVLLA